MSHLELYFSILELPEIWRQKLLSEYCRYDLKNEPTILNPTILIPLEAQELYRITFRNVLKVKRRIRIVNKTYCDKHLVRTGHRSVHQKLEYYWNNPYVTDVVSRLLIWNSFRALFGYSRNHRCGRTPSYLISVCLRLCQNDNSFFPRNRLNVLLLDPQYIRNNRGQKEQYAVKLMVISVRIERKPLLL